MEIVHVQMSGVALEATPSPIEVGHSQTLLTRRLAPREELLLTDVSGAFFSARVLMVDDADRDPVYFLHVGKRLSTLEASRRLEAGGLPGELAQVGDALPS